jgi:Ni/Fe-hydrogenase subunit HybB-like protein
VFFRRELAIGVILPLVVMAWSAVHRNSERLYGAALLVVAGFVVNRPNVSITGLEWSQGGRYLPSIAEGVITLMLVGAGIALFALAVRFLPVMEHGAEPARLCHPAPRLRPVPVRT